MKRRAAAAAPLTSRLVWWGRGLQTFLLGALLLVLLHWLDMLPLQKEVPNAFELQEQTQK